MTNCNPKITIIVPIYNSERYLKKCIQSILAQSYDDFELILIDDGSTDSSGQICDEFSKQNTRIKVYHESNKGVSTARNRGLELASGDWITFIDSDDWIEPDYLLGLISNNEGYDFIISYYNVLGWKGWINDPWEDNCYTGEHIKDSFDNNMRRFDFICGKMYRNSIIKEYGIRFNPKISYAEDSIFTLNYVLNISSIRVLSSALYCYNCSSEESLTTRKRNWDASAYVIDQMCNILSKVEERYNWDGKLTKNYYTWAFLRKYFTNIVETETILQTSSLLKQVYQNENVLKILSPMSVQKSRGRIIFDTLICNNLFILAAILLHLEFFIDKIRCRE